MGRIEFKCVALFHEAFDLCCKIRVIYIFMWPLGMWRLFASSMIVLNVLTAVSMFVMLVLFSHVGVFCPVCFIVVSAGMFYFVR
jgi:hypothetical protein